VHDYVTCDICEERKHPSKKKRAYMRTYLSGVKFERLAVDISGSFPKTNNGFVYILVKADHFTKFTEIFPLCDIEAETVANTIFRDWI
jgi:cleavage and polyadenylation specificity factor subunit 1